MSKVLHIEQAVDTIGEHIHQQFQVEQEDEIQTEYRGWIDAQGLNRLENPYYTVSRQAALNLFLKAALYMHYQQSGANLPSLSSGRFKSRFQEAQKVTSEPAFHRYLLDKIIEKVDLQSAELEMVLEGASELHQSSQPAEKIGQLFEQLTPQKARRKLGQFRTPTDIAELMSQWSIQDERARVLDPGMGACALSVAAYKRKQELGNGAKLDDVYGVDLSELALVMGATALKLADHGELHNLRSGDFLKLSLKEIGGNVDSIISNPPYSRHHELSENYKSEINTWAENTLGHDVSALSPLYAYFYYRASELLTSNGRASYITPSEFLETGYGSSLKQYLLDEFDIKALVLFDRNEDSVFEEAMTTSLVSFLEASDEDNLDEVTKFIRVDEFPGTDVLLRAIRDGVEGTTEWGFVNHVHQSELEPENKWTELFNPLDLDTSQLTPLSEFATVNRGIATGANSYFCLSESDVAEWDIGEQYLSQLVRNSRSVPFFDYRDEDWERQLSDDKDVWLLYHVGEIGWENESSRKQDETEGNARLSDYQPEKSSDRGCVDRGVVEYLKHGMSDNISAHSSYLAENREPWFVVDRREPAQILVTYMSRGGCRFILNKTAARNLNNLHSLYLDAELDDSEMKALLAFLNSGFADDVVRRSGRTYSTGMDKIEPNELESVPVLDPRGLQKHAVHDLAQAFDELCEAARVDESALNEVIEEIDSLLQRELQRES